MLASKRKENLGNAATPDIEAVTPRKVPKSFLKAMTKMTTATVASLDTNYIRALATHPTGNPVLQLLLRLELKHSDKGRALDDKSLYHRLVAPETLDKEDSEAAKFVSGLTFDPTGSRLVEVLVVESPGKVFKKLYKGIWKDRMPSMAKNETAGFVAIKIIERLGKDELLEVREAIMPELDLLLKRRRFSLIKILIERSMVRGLECRSIGKAFDKAAGDDPVYFLRRLLYPKTTGQDAASEDGDKADMHGSLLAQTMLEVSDLNHVVNRAFSGMDTEQLLRLANDPVASRVVQMSLTTACAPMPFKKQVIPRLYAHVAELAITPVGSYLVDALWNATNGLHFMKERVANEMVSHESELRDSYSGRKVWRNWSMDLYTRRLGEWQALAKGISDTANAPEERKKTPIELARQRRAEEKARAAQQGPTIEVSAGA
jgi:nucleolar protein 9